MTTANAIGFIFLGVGMLYAPGEMPHLFPGDAGDGSSTSALWLGVMGTLHFLLGMSVFAHNETLRFQAALEQADPLDRVFDLAEVRWTMPASLFPVMGDWRAGEAGA